MGEAILVWGIVLGLPAIGIVIAVFTVRMQRLAEASRSWPTAEGTVVASEVVVTRGKGKTYTAQVRYSYQVGGAPYGSDRIQFGSSGTDQKVANATVADHPVGKRVKVYYNPGKPAQAVLVPGVTGKWLTFVLWFCAVMFIGFGVVMTVILLAK